MSESRKRENHGVVDSRVSEKSSIVRINVGGCQFEIHLSSLNAFPESLLGDENKRKIFWNTDRQEYFFGRHRACFEAILYYYQSNGRLRRPDHVPLDIFLEEIRYFQLGPKALAQVVESENLREIKPKIMPNERWRRLIWQHLQYPASSILARGIYIISMAITLLSSITLAIETLPSIKTDLLGLCFSGTNLNGSSTYQFVAGCPRIFSTMPYFTIESICVSYFTIEFFLRLISTPSYKDFFLSFMTWVDILAIAPYYCIVPLLATSTSKGVNLTVVHIFRLLRALRTLRLLTIVRELRSMRVLGRALKESMFDLAGAAISITTIAFLFGSAAYLAEEKDNANYSSIPAATYWGIITMSTVGYGDISPMTWLGRIIACMCAVFGTATMGMVISVLGESYQRVYKQQTYDPNEQEPLLVDWDRMSNVEEEKEQNMAKNLATRSKLNFSISSNDGNIDDHLANLIIKHLNEKVIEIQEIIRKDIYLQMIDNDNQKPADSSVNTSLRYFRL
ncbi:unnamed protein product [Adineta ricciae]|uniref:BTB domain-containing protein n=1 Tax=Adineta ricciae TaxID=249248 RepID=A0A814FPJ1_ADIRI|nr:unnamed protein product [Adineta ricciae]